MAKKKTTKKEVVKKVYTTTFPVAITMAAMGEFPDNAREEVYKAVGALQVVLKMGLQVLAKPVMEEYDMKEANKEIEVEVPDSDK